MSSTTEIRPSIYVLLGCPGAGKGTFAQAIQSEGYDHISTGDIIREELRNETEFGLKYKDAILNHVIGGIPFEIIDQLVLQRLRRGLEEQKSVILDGYPKTVEQCRLLDTFIQERSLEGRVVFILLDVEGETAIDRILYRQSCEKCGKLYNAKFAPSQIPETCDLCQGPLTKRLDDSVEGNRMRIYEFKAKMQPVIAHYTPTNRLHFLDGNGSLATCLERYLSFHHSQTKQELP
ncbi:MAG: nucleoside monophosphate kinase [Chlamydiota bacterium]